MTLSIREKTMINSTSNNSNEDAAKANFPSSMGIFLIPVNFAGIVGNVLLIIAHVKDPLKSIRSLLSYFIFNFALVDLLSSCSAPLATSLFPANPVLKKTAASVISLLYTVSFKLYLSLAIQRFCSLVYPMWHHVHLTKKVCRYWVSGIWLLTIVLKVGMIIAVSATEFNGEIILSILVIALWWIMFFATQCIYIASGILLRRQARKLQTRQDINPAVEWAAKTRLKNESNFIWTIAIVCVIQGISTLPFLAILFITILNSNAESEKDFAKFIPSYYTLTVLGVAVNSPINVLVYIWRLPNYRKTFKKLFCDCSK